MDIEHDNRNAPSYLAHYGMHRPPFATNTEDDMYYPEPTRSKRLDILLHLTQYGNEMLLVTGPQGSGKSTLMQHFLKKAPNNWKICNLDAHAKLDQEQLLYRLCHNLNLPVEPGPLTTMTTNVKRQLDQLLARTQTVVIVLDDAHLLSNSVLVLLTELAKIKNQHSGSILRIVLFAEPQIKIQFASIELENKPKYPIRKIDLPPFDEQQTGALIRHRTRIAGLQADSTFTDSAISKIYKQSEGIPGNIIELAHRVLFEMTPLKRRTKSKPQAEQPVVEKSKSPLRWMVAGVVVAIIALVLVFQNEINQLYTNTHTNKNESSLPPNSEPQRTVTPLAIPELTEEALDSDAATIEPTATSQQFQSGANDEGDEIIAGEPQTGRKLDSEAPDKGKKHTPIAPSATPTHVLQPPLAYDIHQERWLLNQQPNDYTLQLVAGYQKSTVNNYLKRHKLPAAELAYYHSLHKGKDWHSLVYGVYPDYNSAKLAIDTLPAAVRTSKPWIRRFRGIQKEINDAADETAQN